MLVHCIKCQCVFYCSGNFFSCSSKTSCSFFPTIFYKSLKIFFPDPSPTAHLTLHTHLSLTFATMATHILCLQLTFCGAFSLICGAFSFMWPGSMQAFCNKRKHLNKKRVQVPQDCLGTPTWPPFYCFGTPIWPPWCHVKTLSKCNEPLLYYNLAQVFNHYFLLTISGTVLWLHVSTSNKKWMESNHWE